MARTRDNVPGHGLIVLGFVLAAVLAAVVTKQIKAQPVQPPVPQGARKTRDRPFAAIDEKAVQILSILQEKKVVLSIFSRRISVVIRTTRSARQ